MMMAEVIDCGRGQIVLLPEEARIDADEVRVTRHGNALVLRSAGISPAEVDEAMRRLHELVGDAERPWVGPVVADGGGPAGLPDAVRWNEDYDGAFYFYPAYGGDVVADCEADRYAAWVSRTYGARLAVEEGSVPPALRDALRDAFDPSLPENVAMAAEDGPRAEPEWDEYGENYYTLDGFRAALGRYRAESGTDPFCETLARELDKVAERAEELVTGVMVTGP